LRRAPPRRGPVAPRQSAPRREVISLRRTPEETAALTRAKQSLDTLDFYPRKVNIDHVRILHVPWLFRLPWFRRFHGYEMGPLILLKHPLEHASPSLIAHEL